MGQVGVSDMEVIVGQGMGELREGRGAGMHDRGAAQDCMWSCHVDLGVLLRGPC